MPLFLCTLLFFAPFDNPVAGDPTPEEESAAQLAKVRRIYIDILTGGDEALVIRDLLMTSLHSSKTFIITEDEDKADATLKDRVTIRFSPIPSSLPMASTRIVRLARAAAMGLGITPVPAAIAISACPSAKTKAGVPRSASTRRSPPCAW